MSNEPVERELTERVRVRLDALAKANAAARCGARSKRTGKPCRGAAMPNGRCKLHGGKSTGPRTPEGLARSRQANWRYGDVSREAKRCGSSLGQRSKAPVVPSAGERDGGRRSGGRGRLFPTRRSSDLEERRRGDNEK